jgi:NADH-quinone oxidoreductase subunit N
VKRMLAYSSIAHAGYLLIGVVAAGVASARGESAASLLFYLAVYTATVIGAFAVVGVLERRSDGEREPSDAWDLSRFAGLARRRPALAFAMAVFLLSLAGIPPTAGFFAKLYVFRAAIGAGFPILALVGVLTSALGAYYYLRVVLYMYMRPPEVEEPTLSATSLGVALGAAALIVLLLGIVADPLVALARAAGALG